MTAKAHVTSDKPSLRQTMGTMHQLLRGEITPKRAAQLLKAPENRLAAYQQFVKSHMVNVLRKNFACLAWTLGQRQWDALVQRFFRERPARFFELNANAAPFRDFLAQAVARQEPGIGEFHLELAELEWQEFAVYADPRDVSAGDDEPWRLNPTLVVLRFNYPVAAFLERYRELEGQNALPRSDPMVSPPPGSSEPGDEPGTSLAQAAGTSSVQAAGTSLTQSSGTSSAQAAGTSLTQSSGRWSDGPQRLPGVWQRLEQPETVLVFRDPADDFSAYLRATEDLLLVLKMLFEQVSVTQVAQATGLAPSLVRQFVERAQRLGLVLGGREAAAA